jgi:hypothetical protein
MQNAFEYADEQPAPAASTPEASSDQATSLIDSLEESSGASSRRSTITDRPATLPFLSLASFRMVVLADELLESFFSEDLTNSWHLEPLTEDMPAPRHPGLITGRLTNFVSSFITDESKEYLGKLADDIGKRLDIQQIEQKPALGRLTGAAAMLEPLERTTLLSTSKAGHTSPLMAASPYSAASMRQPVIAPVNTSTTSSNVPETSPTDELSTSQSTPAAITAAAERHIIEKALPNAPKDQILGLGIMDERPRFAIDDAGDDDDEEGEDEAGVLGDDDSGLMNGMFCSAAGSDIEYKPLTIHLCRRRCILVFDGRLGRYRCRCT